jgi:hypothetical protein
MRMQGSRLLVCIHKWMGHGAHFRMSCAPQCSCPQSPTPCNIHTPPSLITHPSSLFHGTARA